MKMENPENQLKILQVTPVLQPGGAEHIAAYLANAFTFPGTVALLSILSGPYADWLRAKHIRFKVVEPLPERVFRNSQLTVFGKKLYRQIIKRNTSYNFHQNSRLSPQMNFLSDLCPDYIRRFTYFMDKAEYDIVHIHSLTCGSLFRAAKQLGYVVIYGHHNVLSERHGREDIDFLREQLEWVDAVVCVSHTSCNDFVKTTGFPASRVTVIPNPSFLATGVRQTPQGVFRVGTASNLQAAKGIDILLRAWAVLKNRGERIELFIAGGVPEVIAYWQKMAMELGIGEQVHFLGILGEESRMHDFYNNIKVLIVPSLTEAFSLQVVEALSRGIPVVASDIPALREVLGEAGVLFSVGDTNGIADCIERLYKTPALAEDIGRRGFERWQANYSSGLIISKYNSLYRDVLSVKAMNG